MIRKTIIGWLVMTILVSITYSSTTSQWRGPNRDGIYPEANLLKKWPEAGPKLLWSIEGIGDGFGTVAVANDKIYVAGMLGDEGYLFAYNSDGKLLWKTAYGPEWNGSYPGARSTPIIVDGRLYIESGRGRVVCMNATNGKQFWAVDLVRTFNGRIPEWGFAESILIDGSRLICTPGGPGASVVSLDRMTGKTIWVCKGNGDRPAYCSPALIKHRKSRLIVTMMANSIIGLNADTGQFLWSHPHRTDYDVHANTPIYHDGNVYCLSGYGTGGVMLNLASDGKKANEVWRNETLDSQIGAVVLVNGYIYGSGHATRRWQCLDWQTGEVKYTSDERGKGNIIYADGMLYCYDESGRVLLVNADPNAHRVVSSFKVVKGTDQHWAHMVIANGRLYVRHGNALMVYSIRKQDYSG